MNRLKLTLSLASLFLLPMIASAQSTITWNFGSSSGTAAPTSSSGTGATGGNFSVNNSYGSVGTGLTNTNPSNNSGSSGGYNMGIAVNNAYTSFNVNAGYYEVTLTDQGTSGLELYDFQFNLRRGTSGAQNFSVRASTDNYATDLYSNSINTSNSWRMQANGTAPSPYSLGTGTVTLRLYMFNGSGTAVSGAINTQIDDVTVFYDAVPVPEPTMMLSLGMVGFAVVGCYQRVRRAVA